MNLLPPVPVSLQWALLAGLVAGAGIGAVHFAVLHCNLRLYRRGRVGWACVLLGVRLALTATLMALLVRFGLGALAGGLFGLLLARQRAIGRLSGDPSEDRPPVEGMRAR